jgi:hypothetical protein
MDYLPHSIVRVLRKVARRVAVGQFFQIWPRWGTVAFLIAGFIALICRIFFPNGAHLLPFVWAVPVLSVLVTACLTFNRRYNPMEIAAIADSLGGGDGTLLAILETRDGSWNGALAALSRLSLPRLRVRRHVWPLCTAAVFLTVCLLLPQRVLTVSDNQVAATEIAADLKATVAKLKEQELVTPDEERKLDEEIERIRKSALQHMDASSWDAADALREKAVASVADKHDALKWAQESLARFTVAAQSGDLNVEAQTKELAEAITRLQESGLLADLPMELQKMLGSQYAVAGGKVRLPSDPGALRRLSEMLSAHLADRERRFRDIAGLRREFGRFDSSDYPEFNYDRGPDGDGNPGTGGLNRGRGDALMTWGKETKRFDNFKAVPLPPGAVRSPDDWAPVATLPGAPKASPQLSVPGETSQYNTAPGQEAWRRTLAPRHQAAVKKYFENR